MKRYLVAIINTFDAEDGEHAIEQFVDHVLSSIVLRSENTQGVVLLEDAIKGCVNDIEELEDES